MQEFNRWKACRYGTMLYNINDWYVGRSLDLYGEFSQGEADLFQQIVSAGDVVVEVGANIGAHTLFLARQVGPSGFVFAFEPQRILFQTLCANLALNSITCAYCYDQAVGHTQGVLTVPALDYAASNNFGGIDLRGHFQGERVHLTTIDHLGLSRCRLLKVDVEGMELDVLHGASQTIRRLKPILYVENDRREQAIALIKHIHSLGYTMFWHKPPLFNPQNYFKNPENVFDNIKSMNMLCLPTGTELAFPGLEPVLVAQSK